MSKSNRPFRQTMIEMGQRIRLARLNRRLSQTAVADKLGITFQQIQKYEKGTNAVSTKRLNQLCEVLGITPLTLLGTQAKENEPLPNLDTWTMKLAVDLYRLPLGPRRAIQELVTALLQELEQSR